MRTTGTEHRNRGKAIQKETASYYLAADPEEGSRAQILEAMNGLEQETGVKGIPPLLQIASIRASEAMEDTLLRWLQRIFSQVPCFRVTLNNYAAFPGSFIYLRVQDQEPFRQLLNALKSIQPLVESGEANAAEQVRYPHLPLTPALQKNDFDRMLKACSQLEFHSQFLIEKITLLQKDSSHGDFRQVAVLPLKPSHH